MRPLPMESVLGAQNGALMPSSTTTANRYTWGRHMKSCGPESLAISLTREQTQLRWNVLDPFEVAEIEVWPLWDLQGRNRDDEDAIRRLNSAEYTVFQKVLRQSSFGAVLNEGDIAPTELIELPQSTRDRIIPDDLYSMRKHPDVRIARRANTIAALARVISEREVSDGPDVLWLRRPRRLERLASQRFAELGGQVPITEPGAEV